MVNCLTFWRKVCRYYHFNPYNEESLLNHYILLWVSQTFERKGQTISVLNYLRRFLSYTGVIRSSKVVGNSYFIKLIQWIENLEWIFHNYYNIEVVSLCDIENKILNMLLLYSYSSNFNTIVDLVDWMCWKL